MDSILLKAKSLYEALKPSEKKVANYLIQRADDVIHFSITDLAENAGCSEASISRFVRKLGFSKFIDFKISLVKELSLLEDKQNVKNDATGVADLIHHLVQQGVKSYKELSQLVNPLDIEKAADWIAASKHTFLFGVGSSGSIAELGASILVRIGVSCFAYADPHMQVIVGSNCTPEDTVIGVSVSGTIKDTIKSVQVAKNVGAKTIAITGGKESPLSKEVDLVLYSSPQGFEAGIGSLGARSSQMAILDMLISTIVWKNETCRNTIEKVEQALVPKRFS
ncbi:MAG TPA: MurR/RpiR family transcriptional regulator [Thermotogota bacterium]|jgi:DNA-binding MurR/RpiR family transcriptional regulator|nr:MurR/RpiR family transcriptional regulator [Thermotogota bacterium]NLH20319.1 MurR/RpiR family transcriptional regulator [Thermotogaceae bacterium]OQC31569.1 MAG: HTH-type transcriptional regulator RpiR [Thermotogota bacterium ADurb.Bin062]HNW47392.1 MurR/RpiR family transcriptional regulator [Thermotogota bacterium]HNY82901.1 MurR/RpiR family transcriptional regulator [Thermotogota bacterium]